MSATTSNDSMAAFNKFLPIAGFGLTLMLQAAWMIRWGSGIEEKVNQHTTQITELKATDLAQSTETRATRETLVRMDERLTNQTRILEKLERTLTPRP